MKKKVMTLCIALGLVACTRSNNAGEQIQQQTQTGDMENLVTIVEIPAADFARAVAFYQTVLNIKIEEVDMPGAKMGVLPGGGETVNVVLVNGADYKPTADGTVVYLNGGNDLQPTLDKVEQSGGTVLVPKTEISPEMGFFALFLDTEGNKVGLHSSN